MLNAFLQERTSLYDEASNFVMRSISTATHTSRLLPAQTKHFGPLPRNPNLNLTSLNTLRHDLSLPLQHNLLSLYLLRCQLVELSSESTQKALQLLLRNVRFRDDTALRRILKSQEDQLRGIGLCEDSGGDLFALLGGKRVRRAVGAAIVMFSLVFGASR